MYPPNSNPFNLHVQYKTPVSIHFDDFVWKEIDNNHAFKNHEKTEFIVFVRRGVYNL
jgi:hypothetical protein